MLTFRQLDDAGAVMEEIIEKTMQEIINDMARRISKAAKVTDSAQWQLSRLEAMSAEQGYVLRKLGAAMNTMEEETIRMFDEACTRAIAADDAIYEAATPGVS